VATLRHSRYVHDTKGWQDISVANILINNAMWPARSSWLCAFWRLGRVVYLVRPDAVECDEVYTLTALRAPKGTRAMSMRAGINRIVNQNIRQRRCPANLSIVNVKQNVLSVGQLPLAAYRRPRRVAWLRPRWNLPHALCDPARVARRPSPPQHRSLFISKGRFKGHIQNERERVTAPVADEPRR